MGKDVPIFHVSFDQSASPDLAEGATAVEGSYKAVAGVAGQAVELTADQPLIYGSLGNVDSTRGTLSFWFKLPKSAGGNPNNIIMIRAVDHAVSLQGATLIFMTGAHIPDKDWQWIYSPTYSLDKLSPQERHGWIFVTITWDQKTDVRTLYINGRKVGQENHSPQMEHIRTTQAQITLGNGIHVFMDEVTIWDTVLSDSAIEAIYRNPNSATIASKAASRPADSWIIRPDMDIKEFGDGLLSPGQPFHVSVPLANQTDQPQSGKITLTALDLWEKPVGPAQTFEVSLKPSEKSDIQADFKLDRYGAFKIRASVDVGGNTKWRDVTTFGIVPPGTPPHNDFFGSHVNLANGVPELALRLGYFATRIHDMSAFTYWNRMEPQRGQWAMEGYGSYEKLRDLNYEILGLFFTTPNWAAPSADGKIPPKSAGFYSPYVPTDEAALREYVDHALQSFPTIKKWEIWNEPWVSLFWQGSPEKFAQISKIIYQQAKKTRPDVQVYVPIEPIGPWSRKSLEAGLLNFCDGVSYHQYFDSSNPPQESSENIQRVHNLISKYAKKPLPILCTESGLYGSTFLSGLEGPDLPPQDKRPPMNVLGTTRQQIQSRVEMMAGGVDQCYEYFMYPLHPNEGMRRYWNSSELEETNTPKYSAIANCILVWQLDGATTCNRMDLAPDVPAYVYQRKDGHAVAVVWAENNAELKWTGRIARAVDVMGNDLPTTDGVLIGEMPLYLHLDGSADELVSRLKDGKSTLVRAGEKPSQPQNDGVEQPKKVPNFALVNEAGPANLIPLDLPANMSVVDETAFDGRGGAFDEGPNNDMSMIKDRKVTWLGVPFELPNENGGPGMITLRGKTFHSGPLSAGPFKVDQKARGIFFAHMGNWMIEANNGQPVASYIIKYADGQTLDVPVIEGVNIANFWFDQLPKEESRPMALKHPEPLEVTMPYRFPRIWYWDNPRSDVPIQSVSVRMDAPDRVTFAVLGITLVKW
ncbi:MAG: LamG domain-containing protein [Phycisphaerales bacterium]|nr:LamG domain-containing protein [Phycisphaerales bacterium]